MNSLSGVVSALVLLVAVAVTALPCTASPPGGIRVREFLGFTGAEVKDRVGGLSLDHKGVNLAPRSSVVRGFRPPRGPYALLVRTVVPDDTPGHTVAYDVRVNGVLIGRRELLTEGVGRRSQFVRVDHPDILRRRSHTVEVINRGPGPLFLEAVLVITGYEKALAENVKDSDFILSFLVDPGRPDDPSRDWIRKLRRAPGTTLALSAEISFAHPNVERLRKLVDDLAREGEQSGWPVVPILVSWWAGTPPEIRERLDFQQVCYSETDTYDEGPGLRDLLGDSWSLHYGLTVPNRWSSTPWQTMNNPELNELRKSRMGLIMPYVTEKLRGRIAGLVTENEPMYWAGEFPDEKYPVKRENLMADFNPHTVADAARDGVVLDPSDGLDIHERRWLFANLHRYIVETASWIKADADGASVYTHELLEDHFPMKGSGVARPAMEAAVAAGFVHGVETLWDTNLDKYQRLREWGPWGCVNREEGDSRPISQHVAMALALYANGSTMLNSYNWQVMGSREQVSDYFDGFADSLPRSIAASADPGEGPGVWKDCAGMNWVAGANPECPWGTHLEMRLRNSAGGPREVTLTVRGRKDGRIAGFSRRQLEAGTDGWVRFPMDSMTDAAQHQDLVMKLRAGPGAQAQMAAGGGPAFRWVLDAAEERARSRIIMSMRDTACP